MDFDTAIKTLRESNDTDEVLDAVMAIGNEQVFDDTTLELLVEQLKSSNSGVKDYVARLLSELEQPNSNTACKYLAPLIIIENIELRNLASDIMIRIGEVCGEHLIEYLKHDDRDVRKFACDILGLIGTRQLAEYVHPLLKDSDINVVQSAIETLGNYQDETIVDDLLGLFTDNEEHKAMIIEALGKIGNQQAQLILLDLLKKESDDFIKSAIIDALAFNCEDIEIARQLFATIEDENPTIQIIILKTVTAIAFRLGEEITLPDSLRFLAYKAIFDEDPDVRAAGLLSLGTNYRDDDIPSLINEVFTNNSDTQSLLLERLLVNNEPAMIQKFFKAYCNELKVKVSQSCEIDFLVLISYIWENVSPTNKEATLNVLLEMLFTSQTADIQSTYDLLLKIDRELTTSVAKHILSNKSEEHRQMLKDLLDLEYEL